MTKKNYQQLKQINIKQFLAKDVEESELQHNLTSLITMAWTDFLDELAAEDLTEEQITELNNLASKEDLKQEDFFAQLRSIKPDYQEMFEQRLLDRKEELIRGQLVVLTDKYRGNNQAQSLIKEMTQLADQGEWDQLGNKIITLNQR